LSDGTIVAENAAATGAAEEPPVNGTADAMRQHPHDAGASGHEPLRGPAASAPAPAPKGSRAGRNLPAALTVGFGLGLSLIAGGQAVFWLGWPYGASGVAGAFAATTLICMVWRLFDHGLRTAPRNFLRDTAITVFTLAWIPLLASFATLLLLEPDGNLRVLTFMILVVCSDVGGYVAGVLFGKHPMVPSISPKKSWEGFAGSLVFSVIGGLLTVTLLLEANSMIGVVLGVGLVLVATCGDLIESQIKRELGIKDMGTLLPGHGGIMDRLDSMLPSAFVSWLVLSTLL
jgi:phosphatidate cytidylyltransferase